MIPACIFTYGGAALRVPWAVRGARLAGLVPVVCQDAAAPLQPHVLGWLESKGIEIRTTAFPRRGNLNGTDCAAGIMGELATACIRHNSTHALKLDDDTVIVRLERFHATADTAVGLSWPQAGRNAAFGMAYSLPGHAAAAAAARLATLPLDTKAPEDLTVWAALEGVCERVLMPFDATGGPFTALPIHADADEAVKRFDVITVGNPPAAGWVDRDRQIAHELKRVVEASQRLPLSASSALPRGCDHRECAHRSASPARRRPDGLPISRQWECPRPSRSLSS